MARLFNGTEHSFYSKKSPSKMINRLHKIAVIGAGSWGTALSMVLATRECEVVLWTPVEGPGQGTGGNEAQPCSI